MGFLRLSFREGVKKARLKFLSEALNESKNVISTSFKYCRICLPQAEPSFSDHYISKCNIDMILHAISHFWEANNLRGSHRAHNSYQVSDVVLIKTLSSQ